MNVIVTVCGEQPLFFCCASPSFTWGHGMFLGTCRMIDLLLRDRVRLIGFWNIAKTDQVKQLIRL